MSKIFVFGAELREYKDEAELRDLIFENPDLVLSDIRGNHRVVFGARELPAPHGKPMDVVFVLDDGVVVVVETKLRNNSDARRVMQQVDEYWSNILKYPDRFVEILRRHRADENTLRQVRDSLSRRAVWRIVAMDSLLPAVESMISQRILDGSLVCAAEISQWTRNGDAVTVVRHICPEASKPAARKVVTLDTLRRNYAAHHASKFLDSILSAIEYLERRLPGSVRVECSERFITWSIYTPLLNRAVKVALYYIPEDRNQGGVNTRPEDDEIVISLAKQQGLPYRIPGKRKRDSYWKVVPFPKTVEEQNALAEKYASLIKSLAGGDPHK